MKENSTEQSCEGMSCVYPPVESAQENSIWTPQLIIQYVIAILLLCFVYFYSC